MKLSKSKINTYLKCPFEFKLKYVDEIVAEPNKYMIFGRNIHSVAERFCEKFGDDVGDINIEYELNKIVYELNLIDLNQHVDNLALFFEDVYINRDYKLFGFEEELYDDENRFSGICDIILQDENEELIIVDYKTTNSRNFSKYRLELCYYKLLVENVLNKKVSKVGIFFTENGRLRLLDVGDVDYKYKYLTTQEITEAIRIFHEVRENVNNEIFPLKKQYLCRLCIYEDFCRSI